MFNSLDEKTATFWVGVSTRCKEYIFSHLDVNLMNVKICKLEEYTDLYTVYICLYTVHVNVILGLNTG